MGEKLIDSISGESSAVAVRQIWITLDEELLEFLDQSDGNRSAAITQAVRHWRDQELRRSIAEGCAALAEAEADRPGTTSPSDALNAAREATELVRSLS
jgi:Arc/MetJ-type ribon-helix-helix transcriptional regulator